MNLNNFALFGFGLGGGWGGDPLVLWLKNETPFLNIIKLKKKKKTPVWYLCLYFFSCFFKIRFGRRGEKEQELIPNSFKHMGPREEHFFNFNFLLSGDTGEGFGGRGGGGLHGVPSSSSIGGPKNGAWESNIWPPRCG
jgi:hypothetical protein